MARRPLPPGALPNWKRQLPLVGVLALVAVGLVVTAAVPEPTGYRVGLLCVVAGLVLAAVTRMLLPARRVGLLAVRSRPFDVLSLLAVAVVVALLALSLPPGS